MKTRRLLPILILALLAPVSRASAQSESTLVPRGPVILSRAAARSLASVPAVASASASPRIRDLQKDATNASSYSVELPQVLSLQGAAFYRTAVDINNNTTNGGVLADIQYSYTCTACTGGGFFRTFPITIALAGLDSFHQDDMVSYLASQPAAQLASAALSGSIGTLLITFRNLPSGNGWEGTAVARLYNRVNEANPSQGTIGYAYPASLFFESAHESLVGIARDTTLPALGNASTQGFQRTNIGVRNTDIDGKFFQGTDRRVSVTLQLYDVTAGSPTNGQPVGNALTAPNLQPGEVRLFGNVFSAAHVPSNVSQAIAFIDVQGPTASSATIEGFVVTIDQTTNDGSYYETKCADSGNTCGI
jgi:hypothetical protein